MPTREERIATIAAAHEVMERELRRNFPPALVKQWQEDRKRFDEVFGAEQPPQETPEEQQKLAAVLEAARKMRK